MNDGINKPQSRRMWISKPMNITLYCYLKSHVNLHNTSVMFWCTLCSQVQVVAATEETPPPSSFSIEDVVKVMNQGVGEEGKLVVHGNVINVKERTSYGVTIYKGCCKHQSCLQWQSSSQLKFLSKNVKLLIEKITKKSFRLRWLKKNPTRLVRCVLPLG